MALGRLHHAADATIDFMHGTINFMSATINVVGGKSLKP
jgi:hypothetical protein